jgi:hypothetical protein
MIVTASATAALYRRTIIAAAARDNGATLVPPHGSITVRPRRSFGLGPIMRAMLGRCRSRSILALTLMTAQAFLFNAVFFSYGLVLSTFHGVPERTTGIYLLPLAVTAKFAEMAHCGVSRQRINCAMILAASYNPLSPTGCYAAGPGHASRSRH